LGYQTDRTGNLRRRLGFEEEPISDLIFVFRREYVRGGPTRAAGVAEVGVVL
ncbi:hypothetical protein PHJA_002201400, partial [Phtheirospermum japonicum]